MLTFCQLKTKMLWMRMKEKHKFMKNMIDCCMEIDRDRKSFHHQHINFFNVIFLLQRKNSQYSFHEEIYSHCKNYETKTDSGSM